MPPAIIPTEDLAMLENFDYTDERNTQTIKMLTHLQQNLQVCLNLCQERINLIREYCELSDEKTIPFCFSAEMLDMLSTVENILFTYMEHERLDPYEVWDYILDVQEPACRHYGLTIQDEMVKIHIPYLDMPKRRKAGTSMLESALASMIRQNIKSLPTWHSWQARFIFVFPTSTKHMPRDVDNYDYKRVIDMLAFALGSSDNAIHFAMSAETIFSDKIAYGLYIEISPRNSKNAVLPDWEKRGRGRPKGSTSKHKTLAKSAARYTLKKKG